MSLMSSRAIAQRCAESRTMFGKGVPHLSFAKTPSGGQGGCSSPYTPSGPQESNSLLSREECG